MPAHSVNSTQEPGGFQTALKESADTDTSCLIALLQFNCWLHDMQEIYGQTKRNSTLGDFFGRGERKNKMQDCKRKSIRSKSPPPTIFRIRSWRSDN